MTHNDKPTRHSDKRPVLPMFFAIAVVLIPACRRDRQADELTAAEAPQTRAEPSKLAKAPALDDTLAEQLNALGYVSGTTPAGPQKGVTVYKEALAQKGYNFFTSGHAPAAFLMDMEGKILHEWRADFDELWPNHPRAPKGGIGDQQNFWRHAQLLPNGDVLGIWQHYGIFKLNKDSKVLWAKPGLAHHDLAVADDGKIYHLSSEHKPMPELGGIRGVLDVIVIRDPNGEELRRLSMGKALQQANWPQLRSDFWDRERTRKHGVADGAKHDPFHTNSIWIVSKKEASKLGSPFRTGNLLVSMCVLDTIATIDFDRGTTTWWQVGPFGLQHQPRVTHDGKIIVFNNHLTAQTSSVQIIDPQTGKVTWEYTGPESAPLASRTSSGVEVLQNGNILITETNKGRILEITPKEEIVWEFHNPFNTRGARALIGHLYNIDRVDRSLLSWLPAIGGKEAVAD